MNSLILSIIIAFSGNNSGGRIGLTDEQGQCPIEHKVVMTYSDVGDVAFGCWTYQQGLILVNWENGLKRVYEPEAFTMTPEFQEQRK